MPEKKKESIKAPGSRGGKYYINDKGKVIYGVKPKGEKGKVEDKAGEKHSKKTYDSKIEFKEQFPTMKDFNALAKEAGLAELNLADYKKIYQREHKEYMKGVKETGTKEVRGGLTENQRTFLDSKITYDEDGFHAMPYAQVNEKHKMIFGEELPKSEYMKLYKKQKYEHAKSMKKKEKSPEEKEAEMKKELFDDSGEMTISGMNKLPKVDDDSDLIRMDFYIEMMKETKTARKYFNADEYEILKDGTSKMMLSTDPKAWEEVLNCVNDGMSPFSIMQDYLRKEHYSFWDDKLGEIDDKLWDYEEYKTSGGPEVSEKKKKSEVKKKDRDKAMSALNERDFERKDLRDKARFEEQDVYLSIMDSIKELKSDEKAQTDPAFADYGLLGMPIPSGQDRVKKEDWDKISDTLGFKITDSEKKTIYKNVITPLIEVNEFMEKHPKVYVGDKAKEALDDILGEKSSPYSHQIRIRNALSKFYDRRMDENGKSYETPLDKQISKTKKEVDDKLDSMTDMNIVNKIINNSSYDSDTEFYKSYFKKCDSVSEVLNTLHSDKKSADAKLDEIRSPFSSLDDGISTTYDQAEWKKVSTEKMKIEKFQKELAQELLNTDDVKFEWGINKYPKSTNSKINNYGEQTEAKYPGLGLGEKVEDAMNFIHNKTNKSFRFESTISKMTLVDESKNPDPDDRNRAFAQGTELHSNHEIVSVNTLIHEMAHIHEAVNPAISNVATDFFITRTDGLKKYKAKHLYPDRDYKDDEEYIIDSFTNPYVGRDYESQYKHLDRVDKSHNTHEVVSMGVQSMYENAIRFMVMDPEHFAFTQKILNM